MTNYCFTILKLNHFALQYRFILCITIIIIIPTLRIDFCPVDKTIENSIIPGHRFVDQLIGCKCAKNILLYLEESTR